MRFLKQHSYNIVRLIVNQIGISVFSLVLTYAVNLALNKKPQLNVALLAVSIFSVVFYMFLIYSMLWEQGTKDKIRIESGRLREDRLFGFKLALWAAIPNFILAVLVGFGYLFSAVGPFSGSGLETFAGDMYVAVFWIASFFEAMLQGFIINFATKHMAVIIYAVAPFIAIVTSGIAYRLGLKEKKLLFFLGK